MKLRGELYEFRGIFFGLVVEYCWVDCRLALPLWIADQVRNDGPGRAWLSLPCGYCLEGSMTGRDGNDGEVCNFWRYHIDR